MFGTMMSYEQGSDYSQWRWTFGEVTELLYQEVNPPDSLNLCEKPSQATASRLPALSSCTRSWGGVFLTDPPPPPLLPAPSLKWGEAERQESGWKSGFDRLRKGHGGGGEGGACERISDILLTLPAHRLHSTSFAVRISLEIQFWFPRKIYLFLRKTTTIVLKKTKPQMT